MCVLHNLSYRLDAEVPTRYRQLEYNTRNAYTEKSSTGCFSNKSDKMVVSRPQPPAPHPSCPLCPASLLRFGSWAGGRPSCRRGICMLGAAPEVPSSLQFSRLRPV